MHITTNAVVLRSVDYKETDKILTLFTQEHGKLTASARGARKRGSAIAAGCQLLCWSEMVLYEYRGRWAVKETVTKRQFEGLRADIEKLAAACYFAEVTELLCLEDMPNHQLLSVLLNSLHALDQLGKPVPLVKAAFELKAACLAGYEPTLSGCALCGATSPVAPRLHLQQGELYCAACQSIGGESLPLNDRILAAMRHIVGGDAKRLFSLPVLQGDLPQLSRVTQGYLQGQLEHSFRTLEFYRSVTGGT